MSVSFLYGSTSSATTLPLACSLSALAVFEHALGPENPRTRTIRANLAALDRSQHTRKQQIADITALSEIPIAAALAEPSSDRGRLSYTSKTARAGLRKVRQMLRGTSRWLRIFGDEWDD